MKRIFEYNKTISEYSYRVAEFDKITTGDFFEAIDKTVKDIKAEMASLGLKKIALLISGIDSELIAKFINLNNIEVEYFFLHIPGVNDEHKYLVESIAKLYKSKINIVSIDERTVLEKAIVETFDTCEISIPTYLVVPYILKFIPKDFYVIVGEGDLEKTDVNKYLYIFNKKIKEYNSDNFYIPMHLSEISYFRILKNNNLYGETNFYSRLFDTWYHILRDVRLKTNGKFFYDPKTYLLKEMCGNNFISPIKTLNFEYERSKELMQQIKYKIATASTSTNWSLFIGDVAIVPKELIF